MVCRRRVYDAGPDGLGDLVARLLAPEGHSLVVGHSNTTPALVELLRGDPGEPISEIEYDRLYVVAIAPGGVVSIVLLRYPGAAATAD